MDRMTAEPPPKPSPSDAPAPSASFRTVLAGRHFRRFFFSRAVSLAGDAVVPTALALTLTERGATAGWLGAMLAAALLPKVAFLAFGGIAADRFAKLPLMAASSLVCGAAQLATALVLTTGGGLLWWALGCQTAYGVASAVGYPATFGYLPHCVDPPRLGAANALLSAWTGAAALLGPAATAVLAALGDPALALALDGASFLLAACLLAGLPRGGPAGHVGGGIDALREGWRALRLLPWLLRMTVVDSLILLLVTAPFIVLGPGLVQHVAPGGWALLMLLFAAGELLGSLASGRVPLRRPILAAVLGLPMLGLPPLLLAMGAGLWPLCLAQVLAGASIGAYGVLVNTAVQRETPPAQLARVGAISSVGSFAFLPLGYVLAPLLAGLVGPEPLLWGAAAWTAVSVLVLLADADLRSFRYGTEGGGTPGGGQVTGGDR
ncbi:MFS transporter [Streptomyces rectiverticillatus]|uniref:MFS transporter n=1 Tax=Streptomyces rectiverticillatus TaxID=173860 RepID=UPI0015C3003F|nr:MFS transporter [Streptomyces rectiverticillatus]QLE75587.1 MFS transporter [Streptomyces rectiverticillatus]